MSSKLTYRERRPIHRRNPGMMGRLASAALKVTPEDVRSYAPDALDIAVAQALLEGAVSVPEISETSNRASDTIRKRLKDPVAFAWIAGEVSRVIYTRVGLVDAALLRKAVSGDTRAMDLFYRRFGKLVDLQIVAHGKLGDLSTYSDADLNNLVAAAMKQTPRQLPSAASPPDSSDPPSPTPEDPS